MFFNRGCKPDRILYFGRAVAGAALLWFAGAAASAPGTAVTDAVLEITEAARIAVADEAGGQGLLAQAHALREQSVAAGQLPDPSVRVGLMNYPVEAGGFATEGMTSAQVGVRQAFPPGQTRRLGARQLEIQAAAVTENAHAREREVLERVRQRWLDTWYFVAAQQTVTLMRPLFGDLLEVTTSLYSVGQRDQQDVLRAELELARLEDRLLEMVRREAGARAMLANWLGAHSQRPLPGELPAWPEPPSLEQLQQQLLLHPAVRAAEQMVRSRSAAVALARQQSKPGWAIDVGYAFRDGRLPNGASRSDFISVGVMFDLPLFKENRQDRRIEAAVSERRAAQHQREALWLRLSSELRQHYEDWHDLSGRLQLYEQTLLPVTRAQTEAALSAYQSDAGDFADVMRGAIAELNTQLEYLRLRVDRARAWATLAYLGGLQS